MTTHPPCWRLLASMLAVVSLLVSQPRAQQFPTNWSTPNAAERTKIDAAIAQAEELINQMPEETAAQRRAKEEAKKNLAAFKKMADPQMPPGEYGPPRPRLFVFDSETYGGGTTSETGFREIYGPIPPNGGRMAYNYTAAIGKGFEVVGINRLRLNIHPCALAVVLIHEGGRTRQVCSNRDVAKARRCTVHICDVDLEVIKKAKTVCTGQKAQRDLASLEAAVKAQRKAAGGR